MFAHFLPRPLWQRVFSWFFVFHGSLKLCPRQHQDFPKTERLRIIALQIPRGVPNDDPHDNETISKSHKMRFGQPTPRLPWLNSRFLGIRFFFRGNILCRATLLVNGMNRSGWTGTWKAACRFLWVLLELEICWVWQCRVVTVSHPIQKPYGGKLQNVMEYQYKKRTDSSPKPGKPSCALQESMT